MPLLFFLAIGDRESSTQNQVRPAEQVMLRPGIVCCTNHLHTVSAKRNVNVAVLKWVANSLEWQRACRQGVFDRQTFTGVSPCTEPHDPHALAQTCIDDMIHSSGKSCAIQAPQVEQAQQCATGLPDHCGLPAAPRGKIGRASCQAAEHAQPHHYPHESAWCL